MPAYPGAFSQMAQSDDRRDREVVERAFEVGDVASAGAHVSPGLGPTPPALSVEPNNSGADSTIMNGGVRRHVQSLLLADRRASEEAGKITHLHMCSVGSPRRRRGLIGRPQRPK